MRDTGPPRGPARPAGMEPAARRRCLEPIEAPARWRAPPAAWRQAAAAWPAPEPPSCRRVSRAPWRLALEAEAAGARPAAARRPGTRPAPPARAPSAMPPGKSAAWEHYIGTGDWGLGTGGSGLGTRKARGGRREARGERREAGGERREARGERREARDDEVAAGILRARTAMADRDDRGARLPRITVRRRGGHQSLRG